MKENQFMNPQDEKIIALSKNKLILLVAGSCVFVAFGLWMLSISAAEIESHRRYNDPLFVHGFGLIAALFFGSCGAFGIKKLFDKKPGLVFNSIGIIDNSSGVSAGLIPWSEISGFDIYEVHKQKMLVIFLKNPEKYIEMGNTIKRHINKVNFKLCGSPIVITSNALQINFDELLKFSSEYMVKYGASA